MRRLSHVKTVISPCRWTHPLPREADDEIHDIGVSRTGLEQIADALQKRIRVVASEMLMNVHARHPRAHDCSRIGKAAGGIGWTIRAVRPGCQQCDVANAIERQSGAQGELLIASAPARPRNAQRSLAACEHEELHVLGLDTLGRVQCRFVVAVGAINQVMVTPREVFRPLVREAAASAIVAHNHPSGVAEPSEDDDALTQRLGEAGELVGIPLVDHVVCARGGYYSYCERGGLRRGKS